MSGRKKARKNSTAGLGNDAYINAMRGLRGSSAASPHQDRRNRRARTRGSANRRAIERGE